MPKRRFAILTWNNPPDDAVERLVDHVDTDGSLFTYAVGQIEEGEEFV